MSPRPVAVMGQNDVFTGEYVEWRIEIRPSARKKGKFMGVNLKDERQWTASGSIRALKQELEAHPCFKRWA